MGIEPSTDSREGSLAPWRAECVCWFPPGTPACGCTGPELEHGQFLNRKEIRNTEWSKDKLEQWEGEYQIYSWMTGCENGIEVILGNDDKFLLSACQKVK